MVLDVMSTDVRVLRELHKHDPLMPVQTADYWRYHITGGPNLDDLANSVRDALAELNKQIIYMSINMLDKSLLHVYPPYMKPQQLPESCEIDILTRLIQNLGLNVSCIKHMKVDYHNMLMPAKNTHLLEVATQQV